MTPSSRNPSLSFQMLDRFIEYCYLASAPARPRTEGTDGGPLSYSGVNIEAGVLWPLAELDRKVAVLMLLKLPPGSGQKGGPSSCSNTFFQNSRVSNTSSAGSSMPYLMILSELAFMLVYYLLKGLCKVFFRSSPLGPRQKFFDAQPGSLGGAKTRCL